MATKQNILCCCGPKMWTRVIGWLQIIGCLVAAVVGIVKFGAEDDGNGPGAQIVVVIWVITGLFVLIHVLLLVGNETEKAGFFVPWLIFCLSAIGLSAIGVFRLILSGGSFPRILALLGQLATSGFFLLAVHRRHNEINTNSGCGLQRCKINGPPRV